jgi:hypothetical protein
MQHTHALARTRTNPAPHGVLNNVIDVGAGFVSAQVAPDADTEIATFLRVAGAAVASGLLGARGGNGALTLCAAVASGVHGYKRSDGSLPYAILWGLAGNIGLGVALGQGFGERPRHLRGASK